jgi:hypothetical protein
MERTGWSGMTKHFGSLTTPSAALRWASPPLVNAAATLSQEGSCQRPTPLGNRPVPGGVSFPGKRAVIDRAYRQKGRLLSLFDGFATHFLTAAFPSQCLLDAFLFSGLQVERMFLDVLDNVFLHHLAFKPAQCIFNGLTFINPNLSHPSPPIRYITRSSRDLQA